MERYKINRIGCLNYWLYDEEEFYFCDGKLLLRGSNGSGKTVTMASFFPILFDGNRSPERLDPFGGRDRKMEDYVIPSDFEGTENTSYLYMEFYNKDLEDYITIGIGLRGIKNKNIEFYGFAITDNRRINIDFALYKDSLRKIPLTKKELQSQIGSGGKFVTSQKDYKNMVNELLFGFENESLYTELINLLMQVRSNKLSKDFKPTELEDILSSVLEPISEKDVLVMSDSIENMNKYKEKIEELKAESNAIELLKKAFYQYSNSILYLKCKHYLDSFKKYEETLEFQKDLNTKKENLEKEQVEEEQKKQELELSYKGVLYELENLDAKDLEKMMDDILKLEEQLKNLENKKEKKETSYEMKEQKLLEYRKNQKVSEDYIGQLEQTIENEMKELDVLVESLYFDEAIFSLEELKKEKENFHFDLFLKELEKEKEHLSELKSLVLEKENLEKKKDEEENALEIEEQKRKKKELEKSKKSNELLEELERKKEEINALKNQIFILSLEEKEEIEKIFYTLSEEVPYKIEAYLLKKYQSLKDTLEESHFLLMHQMELENGKLQSLTNEKESISKCLENKLEEKETKDFFVAKKEDTKYFYEVIEFQENVPILLRKKIENALNKMGILHTLLWKNMTNESLERKTFGHFKKKEDSLLKYFKIIDKDFEEIATNVLESISTKESEIEILEDGSYAHGLIVGNVLEDYECKYIGENVRNLFIEKQLHKQDEKIKEVEDKIQKLKEEEKEIANSLEKLEQEIPHFDFTNYLNISKEIKSLDQQIDFICNIEEEKKSVILENSRLIQTKKEEIELKKHYYRGSLESKFLQEVIENYQETTMELQTLQGLWKDIMQRKEVYHSLEETIEDLENGLTEIKLELEEIDLECQEIHFKKNDLNSRMNSQEFVNVKEKIEELKRKKQLLENEKETNLTTLGKISTSLEVTYEKITEIEEKRKEEQKVLDARKEVLLEEYALSYTDEEESFENIPKWFRKFKTRFEKEPNLTEVTDRFNDSLNNLMPKLQNYAGRKVSILNFEEEKEIDKEIREIYENKRRSDLVFHYKNKVFNLLELSAELKTELESIKNLLNEEDRKLFEDLLMNNIGDSIREKIRSSKEWIAEVRKLMESMNTSSGLSFSIRWNGKTKSNEEELDTSEIVNIFNRDPASLKDEDLAKITKHFRSRIAEEEEKTEEGERNYLEIIRNVLDYRAWFQFELFFKRPNTNLKELTNKEFSKFSGGEKAIAMYIPLFSGIYAKFNGARPTAPKVIALDEAFAGVDDDNIQDCFRILGHMDLDYVLTSQILWGDYKTVSHLAIYELFHPQNSDVVSLIRYKWDGTKRTLIESEKEYEVV